MTEAPLPAPTNEELFERKRSSIARLAGASIGNGEDPYVVALGRILLFTSFAEEYDFPEYLAKLAEFTGRYPMVDLGAYRGLLQPTLDSLGIQNYTRVDLRNDPLNQPENFVQADAAASRHTSGFKYKCNV